jgi:hypothetical protein
LHQRGRVGFQTGALAPINDSHCHAAIASREQTGDLLSLFSCLSLHKNAVKKGKMSILVLFPF